MRRKTLLQASVLVGLAVRPGFGDEPKNHDKDLIYDEAKVLAYDLPPLLVSAEGERITTAEEWLNIWRPQILSFFGNLVYGTVPGPESPIKMTFEVVKTNGEFMDGLGIRKDVRIRFENAKGTAEMLVLVFVPNSARQPVPAFLMHSFDDTHGSGFDAHPTQAGRLRNGWPRGSSSGGNLALSRCIRLTWFGTMRSNSRRASTACSTARARVFQRPPSGA